MRRGHIGPVTRFLRLIYRAVPMSLHAISSGSSTWWSGCRSCYQGPCRHVVTRNMFSFLRMKSVDGEANQDVADGNVSCRASPTRASLVMHKFQQCEWWSKINHFFYWHLLVVLFCSQCPILILRMSYNKKSPIFGADVVDR